MSNQLINFDYNSTPIRTVVENGEPWLVVKDICDYFEVANRNRVMQGIDAEDKGGTQIETPGGVQTLTTINEAGFYQLLFNLQPTKARGVNADVINERLEKISKFRRWVTHEVLPSIRKHGGYVAGQERMSPEEMVLASIKFLESKITEQQARIDEMRPKEIFADAVAASKTSILIGDLAKFLKGNGIEIGANRLFQWMRDHKYLIRRKGSDWNMPTQKSMELGLFEVKETAITHSDGHVTISKTPKVTGKGQEYFINKFLDGQLNIGAAS